MMERWNDGMSNHSLVPSFHPSSEVVFEPGCPDHARLHSGIAQWKQRVRGDQYATPRLELEPNRGAQEVVLLSRDVRGIHRVWKRRLVLDRSGNLQLAVAELPLREQIERHRCPARHRVVEPRGRYDGVVRLLRVAEHITEVEMWRECTDPGREDAEPAA